MVPTPSELNEAGEPQGAQVALSSLQAKVEPASLELKANEAVVAVVLEPRAAGDRRVRRRGVGRRRGGDGSSEAAVAAS